MTTVRLPVLRTSPLPALHDAWVRAVLDVPLPDETDAPCDACVMVRDDTHALGIGFDASVRCCTFTPPLPNFLVGAVLRDGDPTGTVRRRLDAGVGVTPLGLAVPEPADLLYRHAGGAFGRAPALRCPHLADDGRCGIWSHRMSTCATWHCRHVRGAVGQALWSALREFLACIESSLSRWCVLTGGLGDDALDAAFRAQELQSGGPLGHASLDPQSLGAPRDRTQHERSWGAWVDREAEFFVDCAARVEALSWPEVLALGGVELALRARLLARAAARHDDLSVPARLAVGPFHTLRTDAAGSTVWGYRPIDPLTLPPPLMAALHRFDGRPVPEVLDEVAREAGMELDDAVLLRLLEAGLLRPVV